MADHDAVIVAATRTPTGRFLGGLSPFFATDLGGLVIREAIRRAGIPVERIDEVIMGNVVQAGEGQAPARQAALNGGVPADVPAFTVNKVCGSGLKAVMLAAQAIKAGDGDLFVAGGMESMSNAPYLLSKARTGYRMGDATMIDSVVHDGLWCAVENVHMGEEAEIVAEAYGVTREEQDELAYNSHRKAQAATEAGRFRDEIVPVEVPGKKGATTLIERDEPIRADTTLEALAALKPAFRKQNGSVTAGNAPGLSDGASATVVASERLARELGLPILARVTGYAAAAIEPRMIFACPPRAVRKLLERTGQKMSDFDVIEVNEAFAAQTVANGKELGWDWDKVNPNGGAVALGHPIGSSGSRVLTTLIYELRHRGGGKGLATLCLGGGGAVAMSVDVLA
ncbi:MAG TPA: acetyl-CoA C-acetyltransferase [Ktedonobacterales bacterium]|jgi:acetyl-CoA C-acetyltransferase|nr:acetyl-CoA C-acetyltransferase [Ktedonobacterales bacterium]